MAVPALREIVAAASAALDLGSLSSPYQAVQLFQPPFPPTPLPVRVFPPLYWFRRRRDAPAVSFRLFPGVCSLDTYWRHIATFLSSPSPDALLYALAVMMDAISPFIVQIYFGLGEVFVEFLFVPKVWIYMHVRIWEPLIYRSYYFS